MHVCSRVRSSTSGPSTTSSGKMATCRSRYNAGSISARATRLNRYARSSPRARYWFIRKSISEALRSTRAGRNCDIATAHNDRARRMSASTDSHVEIAHVLFIDIVAYSTLLTDQQTELVRELNEKVRDTDEFRAADAAGKLIRIATGDGMALAFFTSPDAPVRCAVQLSEAVRQTARLQLRMGIHSGPVDKLADVNERSNVAGSGIDIAQRVMDCGDAGHILLSRRVADDLAQYGRWQPNLHDLGKVETKHGVKIDLVNLYNERVGNATIPKKIAEAKRNAARRAKIRVFVLVLGILVAGVALFLLQRAKSTKLRAGGPEKSIAVLPFMDLGQTKDQEYFCDGMSEEILDALAKI